MYHLTVWSSVWRTQVCEVTKIDINDLHAVYEQVEKDREDNDCIHEHEQNKTGTNNDSQGTMTHKAKWLTPTYKP